MNKINLPIFGEIDIENLEDYYEVEINFLDRKIELDLNFEVEKIDIKKLEIVRSISENISEYDKINRIFISTDFDNFSNGSMTYDYLSYYMEELGEYFSKTIDIEDTELNNLKKLMDILKLKRIGFYPNEDDGRVIFDYCLNDEISDDLLVIFMDKESNLSITCES